MPETDSLYTALLAVQGELPHLQRTKINPAFRSKYVPLEELHEEVLPILNQHGLVWITQPVLGGTEEADQPCLHYRLLHAATGDEIEGLMSLMIDKQNPQGQGSAITYARRYSLMAVLGLVADDDDDGNKASGRGKPASRKASKQAAGQQKPAQPAGVASVESLTAIRNLYQASGLTSEKFGEMLTEAGVPDGTTVGNRVASATQTQADWVLAALRAREEGAPA